MDNCKPKNKPQSPKKSRNGLEYINDKASCRNGEKASLFSLQGIGIAFLVQNHPLQSSW